jgi:protein AFG1
MSKTPLKTAYKALLERHRLVQNPGQAALVSHLASLQSDLIRSNHTKEPLKGVYIYGNVGTGKSYIADLFAATLPSSISSRRIHFYEFMMDIHARLHHARSQATYVGDPLLQIGREVRNESRVLCFDEFQVTDIADALILRRLFGAIWESGGVVVSTSNRAPENLYENGLSRNLFMPFIGELRRSCSVWNMEGSEDYRLRRGQNKRMGVFFTESDDFERGLMETIGPSEMKNTVIPVSMSRQLRVVASLPRQRRKLVVSSTFEELCENFLGSADYHALCRAADTIYLAGLRQFKSDDLDYVRRFITLVDLAYEAKTRIVCLSSVPLAELFSQIVPRKAHVEGKPADGLDDLGQQMSVRREGGSSSSMMTTFIGEMEWSATGLAEASLASGGAGETDVRFAVSRTVSRLYEMGSEDYGVLV